MTDSGHGFSEGGEFKKFTLLKENETTASDSTNFPFKVYDPTKEAKVLLEGYDSMTVVKGLLNQLQAARQTNDINAESYKFQINDQAKEIQQLKEALKDLCEILPNADIWLGDADWKAIETARALIEL